MLSWEVGIWNEGVGGGGDDGVWVSADVKNGFSIGWFGDTKEEFKEVLKCFFAFHTGINCKNYFSLSR